MRAVAALGLVALIILFVGGGLLLRQNRLTAYKLCQILYVRIAAADQALGSPKSSTADYFSAHPKALAAAHRENRKTLDALPCVAP